MVNPNEQRPIVHDSDCAVNNGPAMTPGPCDCGAQMRAEMDAEEQRMEGTLHNVHMVVIPSSPEELEKLMDEGSLPPVTITTSKVCSMPVAAFKELVGDDYSKLVDGTWCGYLQPHEMRVVEEYTELESKIVKLKAFMLGANTPYQTLPLIDRGLLCDQHRHMRNYRDILLQRIMRFSCWQEKPWNNSSNDTNSA